MECLFCRIIRREAPAWFVYEDDEVVVFLDKYPASYGHLLVVPKQHFENVIDADDNVISRSFVVASKFARAWSRLGAKGVNILTNAGREAGQIVFHFHVHVIPRWGGGLTWHGRNEIDEVVAREIVDKLKRILQEY